MSERFTPLENCQDELFGKRGERAEYFTEWAGRVTKLLIEMPVEISDSEEGTRLFEAAQALIERLGSAAEITMRGSIAYHTHTENHQRQ